MSANMKKINGWEVYLKIKELSNKNGNATLHINQVIGELGISTEQAREYLTALDVLKFIEFTDTSKDEFIITDLGIG